MYESFVTCLLPVVTGSIFQISNCSPDGPVYKSFLSAPQARVSPSYLPYVICLGSAEPSPALATQICIDRSAWTVTIAFESAVSPKLVVPYAFRSFVIRRTSPLDRKSVVRERV